MNTNTLQITKERNRLYFKGLMNEFSKFDILYNLDEPDLILNLKELSNSIRVREWMHA